MTSHKVTLLEERYFIKKYTNKYIVRICNYFNSTIFITKPSASTLIQVIYWVNVNQKDTNVVMVNQKLLDFSSEKITLMSIMLSVC